MHLTIYRPCVPNCQILPPPFQVIPQTVGESDGLGVGLGEGLVVGLKEGLGVGLRVGSDVGVWVGSDVVGLKEGLGLGLRVGSDVVGSKVVNSDGEGLAMSSATTSGLLVYTPHRTMNLSECIRSFKR